MRIAVAVAIGVGGSPAAAQPAAFAAGKWHSAYAIDGLTAAVGLGPVGG